MKGRGMRWDPAHSREKFLMGAELQGFIRTEVEAAIRQAEDGKSDEDELMRIVSVIENLAQGRLAFFSDGRAALYNVGHPLYNYVDLGRYFYELKYSDWVVLDEMEPNMGELIRLKAACRASYTIREELFNTMPLFGEQYLLTDAMVKETLGKIPGGNVQELERQEEEAREMEEEDEEERALREMRARLDEKGPDWYKRVNSIYGAKGKHGKYRFKPGRLCNRITGEYLIAPGLTFGKDAWWRDGVRANWAGRVLPQPWKAEDYFLDADTWESISPLSAVRRLMELFDRTILGKGYDYSRNNQRLQTIKKRMIEWLRTKPLIRIGFKSEGKLIEKEIRIGIQEINPKTGEAYTHPHFQVDGQRVPKNRLPLAVNYWMRQDIEDFEFKGFLKQMGKYTNEMLELVGQTKTLSVYVPSFTSDYDDRLDFEVKFNHRLNDDVWNLSCPDLLNEEVPVSHDNVRKFLGANRYNYRNIQGFVESGQFLGLSQVDVMQAIKVRMYRAQMAERKGEQLLKDVCSQFPDRITYNEEKREVIVKGKMRRYRIVLNNSDTHARGVSVYNADTGNYVCIVEKGYNEGSVMFDKVVTRALTLMNDEVNQAHVHTLR